MRVRPYVTGSAGIARLTPTAQFTFTGGSGDGDLSTVPTTGSDVTQQVVGLGLFTQPPSETDFMLGLGGGVSIAVAPRVNVDVGYRYARIFADTPINVSNVAFGLGYRF
jgi:opacity protein-like surface antigen